MERDIDWEAEAAIPAHLLSVVQSQGLDGVAGIVTGRCPMFHNVEPVWPGANWPPREVRLDTEAEIARYATAIYLQADAGPAMPSGNVTSRTPDERMVIVAWYRNSRGEQLMAALASN